jgi:cephalosporin hydroxylase
MEFVSSRFKPQIDNGSIHILQKDSIAAAAQFDNHYFDWVYIDTDHSYETTLQELYAYKDKIKRGGYITGHDFVKGNFNAFIRYGVIEAVAEFCTKENWELAFITIENRENFSFAIKQMS